MQTIDIATLDANLIADIANDTTEDRANYLAYEADYDDATVSNQCYHIVYNPDVQRGGIVFVGSGSSGVTSWTDASSADDVLARYLADEMVA